MASQFGTANPIQLQARTAAELVDHHVREFEQRSDKRFRVKLSAQIALVQLLESILDRAADLDSEDRGFLDTAIARSLELFPKYLDFLGQKASAAADEGIGTGSGELVEITPLLVFQHSAGWLSSRCDCWPQ